MTGKDRPCNNSTIEIIDKALSSTGKNKNKKKKKKKNH